MPLVVSFMLQWLGHSHMKECELSPHTKNPESREKMEERKSAGVADENNPKQGEVMEGQVNAKGGEAKDKLDLKIIRGTEECIQHPPPGAA